MSFQPFDRMTHGYTHTHNDQLKDFVYARQEEYYRYKALSPWKDSPLFPPYQDPDPPKDFMGKWHRRLLKLVADSPSYVLTQAEAQLYFLADRVLFRLHRRNLDIPSEGIEPDDNP